MTPSKVHTLSFTPSDMAAENHGKEVADKVGAVRDWLLDFLATHPVFVKGVGHKSERTREGLGIQLRLEGAENTYANAFYVWDAEKESMTVTITMVESGLGQSTGFFLFHLHLLLAVLAGATEITLDNDTDDPVRARQGIYQLFETNDRGMNEEERSWMTEENWLKKPEMVHLVKRTSLGRIQRVLLERVKALAEKVLAERGGVWRADAEANLRLLFRKARQRFDVYSGGQRSKGRSPESPRKTYRARRAHRVKSSLTRSKQTRRRSSSRR